MTREIKRRRGTTAQHAAFIGALAETTVDTDKKTVVVHDGITAGGFPLAKEAAVFGAVRVQKFTASGTYTPHPNLLFATIECWGAGGAGAGVGGSSTATVTGGGGGAGSYSRKTATKADIGASKSVSIGSGGVGANNAAGSNGGDTSVAGLCVGKGGLGGSIAGGGLSGGAGGVEGTGEVTTVGAGGQTASSSAWGSGTTINSLTPQGGSTSLGGTARMIGVFGAAVAGGNASANSGSGGNGAGSSNSSAAVAGGNGGSGLVIITEFCSK